MPNGSTHIIAGTICGATGSLVIQSRVHENRQLEFGHLLLSTSAAAAVSRLPDILEPAVCPNHRAFFHSFAFGALLGFGTVQAVKKIKTISEERKAADINQISGTEIFLDLAVIAMVVILLHLLMDGFTRKGLPLV
jgi:inner membrane protein